MAAASQAVEATSLRGQDKIRHEKEVILNKELQLFLSTTDVGKRYVKEVRERWGDDYKKTMRINVSFPAEYQPKYSEATYGTSETFGYKFQFVRADSTAIKFSVGIYPACCAMHAINGFQYSGDIPEEFVHWFFDKCLGIAYPERAHRFVMNLVETRYAKDGFSPAHAYHLNSEVLPDEVEPVKNPIMAYKYVYSWAKKQRRHREMLFVNPNTSKIIHFTEVLV